mgnify:CR=1 FL=1
MSGSVKFRLWQRSGGDLTTDQLLARQAEQRKGDGDERFLSQACFLCDQAQGPEVAGELYHWHRTDCDATFDTREEAVAHAHDRSGCVKA